MSITDELRKWTKGSTLSSWTVEHLTAIADRIDAEHQKALDEWKAEHGQMWLKGYSECHAELLEGNETLASDLERCGWIPLPKDADNVPWNPGDRDEDGNVVTQLRLSSDGWYAVTDGPSAYHPEQRRHYHAPTVEDVLTEFGIDWEHESDCEDRAALLKEYAARLRLAEGEDA